MHRISAGIRAVGHESAQDSVEYLLAIGVVVVGLFLGLLAFDQIIPDFVGNACPSVDTAAAPPATAGSCLTPP